MKRKQSTRPGPELAPAALGPRPAASPPEAEGPPEAPSELLRLGRDEMNLAEFPLTLLTDRAGAKGEETSLKFEDQVYDDRKRALICRKRVIEGSKEYGLPTATDDAVILALIQLTKLKNNFSSREVDFSRLELIQMLNWPNKGQSYERIALSLHRVAGVTYHFENSWWDNRRKAWTTRIFGILDLVELNDSREGTCALGGAFPSRVVWNPVIFDSFQAGYLRGLDFQLAIGFKHAVSLRIYRFMGKRFHHRADWTFDLKEFAFEHVGLSRAYEGGTQIARKLQPALAELEKSGFLEPMADADRFPKSGRTWSIRLIQTAAAAAANAAPLGLPAPPAEPTEPEPPEVAELVARGVTRSVAMDLARQHPERIAPKLEVLAWLIAKGDKRSAKNPAGWLVKSIVDDYPNPKGFVPEAERRRRLEAEQAKGREAAEARRQQREAEARAAAEQVAIEAYWATLSEQQREQLDAELLAKTDDPDAFKLESGPFKRIGRKLRREAHIRQLLESQGKLPPAAGS